MVTPTYKRMKSNGTTFYAFPGAAEDISSAYQNENYRMYFSKYILLNLPKQNTSSGTNSNPIYWDFENVSGGGYGFERSVSSNPASNYKDQLVESLRNYVANHEITIKDSKLNNTEFYYDNTDLYTPTEKIFWKWCKKLNLIDFEPAIDGDEYFGNLEEFQRNNQNDDEYFPEILWKEREIVEWETFSFYESGESGFAGKLEIEFEGTTNFKIGDIIEFGDLTNSTLVAEFGKSGKRVKVTYIIPPTSTTGQKIGTDYDYSLGTQNDNGFAKLVYNRLVQYIGEVNGINNVNQTSKSYTEVYAHIPDHTGQTPDILFRSSFDENYRPNLTFPILPTQFQPEVIGAAINGIINFDNPLVSNPTDYPGNYYGQFDTVDFTYETNTGDPIRRSGDYFGVNGDVNTPIVDGSTLDGITIDFDPAHYVKMNIINRELTNFDQFNALEVNNQPPKDFEFNAILWYYTVEDLNGNSATNLYGISLVDNPENNPIQDEVGIRVPLFKKLVANDIQDGTSYAFSLNLSFNIINENPQDAYNPDAINSLFSFNLFNEAMRRLGTVNESFLNIVSSQNLLEEEILNMKQLLYTQTDLQNINNRINNLDSLLRLYSTQQIENSESIAVDLDETFTPPRLSLRNIETTYSSVYNILTTDLYNADGVIPFIANVPQNKNFLINIQNNDENSLLLPDDDKLYVVINNDLAYKQSVDIVIDSLPNATENKKLEIYINYRFGSIDNVAIETKLIDSVDFPIYFNNTTQLPNSASNWESINFDINLDNPLRLNTGGILELPIKSNSNLVNNSFKVGDTIQLNDFIVGTNSLLNFSGQYEVDSVGVTNSYIYLDVNNNQSLINYGSSSSNVNNGGLPLDFNNTDGSYPYILSNSPYLGLNKGYKYRITRVSESEESEITERYLIERIK